MADLTLIETGNGGDLILRGNDLAACEGFENMPYLSCFGGASWWGNDLLLPNQSNRFNATTEDVLKTVSLSSSGRQAILTAIGNDLKHLSNAVNGTKITQEVSISNDRVEMNVNIDGKDFSMKWNPDEQFLNYQV